MRPVNERSAQTGVAGAALEPPREIGGDVGRTTLAEQPRPVDDPRGIAARGREGEVQRIGDVAGTHGGAELPRDDEAAVVIEDRREVEPTPADDLEMGEVGLPELVRAVVCLANTSRRLTTTKAGLVIRSCALSRR